MMGRGFMMEWELLAAPVPRNGLRNGILAPAVRGKREIRRAAIGPESRCVDGPSGSAAIIEANLWVAVLPGSTANRAASRQGSTPCRASAESTLSSMPFLSSPIGANRKLSNAEGVISVTDFLVLVGHTEPIARPGTLRS